MTLLLTTALLLSSFEARASEFTPSEDIVPSGYAEFRAHWIDAEGTSWLTQERLRPTLKFFTSERTSLRLTIEARHTQGRHDAAEFVQFLDTSVQEVMDLDLAQVEELTGCHISSRPRVESFEDVVRIERLFFDITQPRMDIRLGRQPVSWGSAIGINPTDVFSEFLLVEPWRERTGVDAARFTLSNGADQLILVAGVDDVGTAIETEHLEWKTGARASTQVGSTDLGLVVSTSRWRMENQRHFVGLDLKGDWHLGWWLEAGYDGDLRVALGADYSFPILQVLYIGAQLNYEGGGSAPEELSTTLRAFDDLEICSCDSLPNGISIPVAEEPDIGEPTTITSGRLYGLLSLRWNLADEWRLSGYALWNLEDGTGYAFPYLTWLGGQRFSTNLGLQTPLGTDGEFRPDPSRLTIQGVDLSTLIPSRTVLAWLRVSI